MALFECPTCHGQYTDVLDDGTRYFHACPPLSDREVIDALNLPKDPATWDAAQQKKFAKAPRVRPDHRDENLKATTGDDAGKQKAPGAAPIPVPADATVDVAIDVGK